MISFACKPIDFKEILTCTFSMNKTEFTLFEFLEKQTEPLCTSTIAEIMKKDRTTIQKAIKSLSEKEIVDKFQVNLDKGGYTFVYSLKNKEILKHKMLNSVSGWTNEVTNKIKSW
ncbi:MAG: helix-turn-helix domain-containing protein [Candidatus Woesearchaeota archaeon]